MSGWWDEAECRGMDPAIFVTRQGEDVAPALAVCDTCPVRDPCLTHALDHDERGVWGGTTGRERRTMRVGRVVPRDCANCGCTFTPATNSVRYCSQRCRTLARRQAVAASRQRTHPRLLWRCATCGLDFGFDHDGYKSHVREFGGRSRGCAA